MNQRWERKTLGAQEEQKPKKMTKAEFLVRLDEVNATLEKNIAEVRASQARNQILRDETRKSIGEWLNVGVTTVNRARKQADRYICHHAFTLPEAF